MGRSNADAPTRRVQLWRNEGAEDAAGRGGFDWEAGMNRTKLGAIVAAGMVCGVAAGAKAQDKKVGAAIVVENAQSAQAAPAAAPAEIVANPVSGFVKAGVARYEKNMTAAAEAMP